RLFCQTLPHDCHTLCAPRATARKRTKTPIAKNLGKTRAKSLSIVAAILTCAAHRAVPMCNNAQGRSHHREVTKSAKARSSENKQKSLHPRTHTSSCEIEAHEFPVLPSRP